jgi:SM-20-related protein
VKQRRVSVVVFLNDASGEPAPDSYGGGELTFYGLLGDGPSGSPIGVPLDGKGGELVAFRSGLLHGVGAVTHGERYTIVSWFL